MTAPESFCTDADLPLPLMVRQMRCTCPLHARRRFGQALVAGSLLPLEVLAADDGVRAMVGNTSSFTKLVPAEQIEGAAAQQYLQLKRDANAKNALLPEQHPQVQRLRAIAQRIIPYTSDWNDRARQWKWEVQVLGSKELNAFCMPGGKIAFSSLEPSN